MVQASLLWRDPEPLTWTAQRRLQVTEALSHIANITISVAVEIQGVGIIVETSFCEARGVKFIAKPCCLVLLRVWTDNKIVTRTITLLLHLKFEVQASASPRSAKSVQ